MDVCSIVHFPEKSKNAVDTISDMSAVPDKKKKLKKMGNDDVEGCLVQNLCIFLVADSLHP